MLVVATAGHVDHGKTTLVRALTGMDPGRAEDRGRTVNLGYAWTGDLAFVDVPGHERLLANALAGLGPAAAALVVVAADAGWREQTEEHVRALTHLGVARIGAVTRADLADPAPAVAQVRDRLGVEPVVVSAVTGLGLADLRAALAAHRVEAPDEGRPRLWVDRVFSVPGAGTVVTGTLGGGRLAVGDEVEVAGRPARVRGLESLKVRRDEVPPGSRVAVGLRGVERTDVRRGDAVTRPGGWLAVDLLDVRLTEPARLPDRVVLHVGSAAVPARARPLDAAYARLRLDRPLALQVGDRGLLRSDRLLTGVVAVDVRPPPLTRRGAAAARAAELATTTPLARYGVLRRRDLAAMGLPAAGVDLGAWVADPEHWRAVRERHAALPGGLTDAEAAVRLGLPDPALARALGPRAEPVPAAVAALAPFEPAALPKDAAARAVRAGHLVGLPGGLHVRADALDRAAETLGRLPQPFTVGAARDALGTTRRVAVPILEALDARGVTRRAPDGTRTLQGR